MKILLGDLKGDAGKRDFSALPTDVFLSLHPVKNKWRRFFIFIHQVVQDSFYVSLSLSRKTKRAYAQERQVLPFETQVGIAGGSLLGMILDEFCFLCFNSSLSLSSIGPRSQ
ncbi:hypothetical protein AMTRI_Chr10g227170 [Amborella trichopoda]